MDERTRLGLGVLGAALFLGVLGDGLLRATPWGINLLVWVAALAGAAVAVAWRGRLRVAGEGRWLVPVALVFAAGLAWRDSPTVVLLNLLAFLVAVSLAALWGRRGRLRLAGVSEYVLGGIYAGTLSSAGPVPVAASEIGWQQVARGRWRSPALAAARGVFFAAPLLLVFGALFVAADAVFEQLVVDLFGFDVAEVFGHISLMLVFAWFTAGLLWVALLAHTRENLALRRPDALSLGIVELGIVLGLLDLLFLAFVAVQVRYLFGGAERVVTTAGLTYAEYARRGFFELVTVTALALPILLLTHWLLRAEGRGSRRVFHLLAGTLIALLFVVMASALQRMYLYTQVYGLTELRLYATIFMAWLAVVLVWFLLTVLRGRRDRFAFGALLSGFAAVLLINAMNPDALIARANLQRLEAGKRFDAYYLTTLSADAAPVLFDALPELSGKRIAPEANLTMEEVIVDRYREDEQGDWRTWNLSRSRAGYLAESFPSSGGIAAKDRAAQAPEVNSR
jgi:Domain of unknown function (DUF4173)